MNDQQNHGMPHLKGIGKKQHAPTARDQHEQPHTELNDAAWIEPVGECAGPD